MKSKFNIVFNWVKNHRLWPAIVVVAMVAIGVVAFGGSRSGSAETLEVVTKEFVRKVSVAGKVIPAQDVDLGFESTGRITGVYKKVGDSVLQGQVIAVLSSGDVTADILKAEADLEAEQARLAELKSGSNGIDGTEFKNALKELQESAYDAYVRSDDAIRNSVDQFYDDGEIVFAFNDYDLRLELNDSRRDIEYVLEKWEKDNTNPDLAEKNLGIIKKFLERVALAVNDFSVTGSAYSQTQIDKFKSDISNSRSSINTAVSNLTSTREGLRSVESDIPYQEAKVKAAQANINGLRAEAGKRVIVAPFSGIVTKQDAKVGSIVSANTIVATLISNKAYQVETFVPEINITTVSVGNTAKVTLDAYGDEVVFEAKVVSVDPAETVKDGVSTYKVLFEFLIDDVRLKSGMTANVEITTEIKQGAILIPQESIIRKNGFSFVQVKVGKEIIEKQVTVGSVSSTGEIEILAGLVSGEMVVRAPVGLNK